jgi:hypothetical protein
MTPSDHIDHEYTPEPPVSLSRIFHALKRYAGFILVALASVVILSIVLSTLAWLRAPSSRVTSMPFRLEFKGADEGKYPNGLTFSTADVTVTPVMREVYNSNNLSRFMKFEHFARSVVVLESNQQLERLMSEYQAKLADARLTPVDRERLERDFESRRASISKSDYSIQFVESQGVNVPASLRGKILHDTLAAWARKAAVEKNVLSHDVPVLSTYVLSQIRIESDNYLIPLLVLRKRLDDLERNIDQIEDIPGALLVRTKNEKISIAEIDLAIDEVIRYRVEPLIAAARSHGMLGPSPSAIEFLRAQLSYDERLLDAARRREEALRTTLAAYESQRPEASPERTSDPETPRRASETVMPQLTDSFLERIVDMTSRNADREYRQRLTEEIKEASLNTIPAETAVRYDRELIESFARIGSGSPSPAAIATMRAEWNRLLSDTRQLILQVNEIYTLASRQLYPETELYRTMGPAVTRIQRGVAPSQLALWSFLAVMITLPVVIVAALIHNRVREEEALEAQSMSEVTT